MDRNIESHKRLFLRFDRYPHCNKPPVSSWQRLDNALQQVGLECVCVDRPKRLADPEKPVIWGDLYDYEPSRDSWAAEVKALLPMTAAQQRLHYLPLSRPMELVECKLDIF